MPRLWIEGGKPLSGTVTVHGAKNSVLPICSACLAVGDDCFVENCPTLTDTVSSVEILQQLGCQASLQGELLHISSASANGVEIDDGLMRKMRSSIVFLGALVARHGVARVSLPGGCNIGSRPIDMHLNALSKLGATICENHGTIECKASSLHGADITLPYPSVGATENVMISAVRAEGVTHLYNAAREPEIEDLQNFLNACGTEISGAGTGCITIVGNRPLHGCAYRVIPDRIVAATYICAVCATRGKAVLRNVRTEHLSSFLDVMHRCGLEYDVTREGLFVSCRRLNALGVREIVRSMPYPGFPTDIGSPFLAAMATAEGTTVFAETVFENRFRFADKLRRMGAIIRTEGGMAFVEGKPRLCAADVSATDLRGGAALCVSALAAEGISNIDNIHFIRRGYAHLCEDLTSLGATVGIKD